MTDPLAEVVGLLKPAAGLAKMVGGAGCWRLRRTDDRQPFYCVVLEGACRLAVAGDEAFTLAPGDFVLIPAGTTTRCRASSLPRRAVTPSR